MTEEKSARATLCSQVETLIASMLKEILPLTHIDWNAHFVEQGGDSLSASVLMTRLSDVFGIDLSLILPFEADTLKDLAVRIAVIRLAPQQQLSEVLSEDGGEDHGVIG